MKSTYAPHVGYVLKMYPRFSETFILNEILAHQQAGLNLDIFSLRAPVDGRFHENLAQVRAPVTYIDATDPRSGRFWQTVRAAAQEIPGFWARFTPEPDTDGQDVYQAVELARAVHARGITHLHAHFATVATDVARLAARFADISYSFTAHAKDIYHESVSPLRLQRQLRDAASVVTISDYNAEYLRTLGDPLKINLRRIYNGLDLELFRYQSPNHRPRRIICVGRLIEKKGMEVLVEACALLRRDGCDFFCEIVGAGPLEASLRAQIFANGLEDHVCLLGPKPQALVRELVQQAAVFAAPCVIGADGNRDGIPTVLLEAMALGTPCVSTPVTGIPELVRANDTGLLVEPGDARSLADALRVLIETPALRVRLAEAARSLIEAECDVLRNTALLREEFAPVHALQLAAD